MTVSWYVMVLLVVVTQGDSLAQMATTIVLIDVFYLLAGSGGLKPLLDSSLAPYRLVGEERRPT